MLPAEWACEMTQMGGVRREGNGWKVGGEEKDGQNA